MNLSGILGLAMALGIIIGVMLLGPTDTAPPALFINIPSILFVVALACGLELMAASARNFGRALWSVRVLIVRVAPDSLSGQDAQILRDLCARSYLAGVLGTLIGIVQMLASLDDPANIGIGLAVALLTIFTAFIIAEVILRPAAQRIEFLISAAKGQEPG